MDVTNEDRHAFCQALSMDERTERAANVFMQAALDRQTALWKGKKKFVHYTSASAAMSIIRNREVWMRKAICMNDFREVQHGLDCLLAAYRHENSGTRFKAVINKIHDKLTDDIEQL